MRRLFRDLFNRESSDIFWTSFINLLKNVFFSAIFLAFAGGVGALLALPVVLILSKMNVPYEFAMKVPKIFVSITSVVGVFAVIESKTKEDARFNKDVIIEVAIATWLIGLYTLWVLV